MVNSYLVNGSCLSSWIFTAWTVRILVEYTRLYVGEKLGFFNYFFFLDEQKKPRPQQFCLPVCYWLRRQSLLNSPLDIRHDKAGAWHKQPLFKANKRLSWHIVSFYATFFEKADIFQVSRIFSWQKVKNSQCSSLKPLMLAPLL